jgi:quercetin dioxygenase-like cupin family protein
VLAAGEIAPGALIAKHTHPDIESAILVEGEIDVLVEGQPDRRVKASEGFQIPYGAVHAARNGPRVAKLAITYIVEKGKPLASPVP